MFKEKSASKTITLCILCLSLVLSGCGSASSVSEGGGVIDASGKIVSSDSGKDSDKDSGDKDSKKKKKKKDSKESGKKSDDGSFSDEDSGNPGSGSASDQGASDSSADGGEAASAPANDGPGSRDNTPVILVPEAPGIEVYGNDLISIDASNSGEGYICVTYVGSSPKVKLQITCPNTTTYTYNLTDSSTQVFPLTSESGTYTIGAFENISGTEYSTCFRGDIPVTITNEFGPYLYPNQYVNFNADCQCIGVAQDLAYSANTDLDVVTNVYNYMINNIVYDSELANTVESGYLPDPDRTLTTNKGICLDYSCLMSSMLRSQGIPTHLEVGYASTAYHAWISVFLSDIGWVNGIVEFDGNTWELMDPTFAASASSDELKEFIGDGSNYETKYIY